MRADGLREKEILIEIDQTLSDAHNINIYSVAQGGGDNFTMASGTVRDAGKSSCCDPWRPTSRSRNWKTG